MVRQFQTEAPSYPGVETSTMVRSPSLPQMQRLLRERQQSGSFFGQDRRGAAAPRLASQRTLATSLSMGHCPAVSSGPSSPHISRGASRDAPPRRFHTLEPSPRDGAEDDGADSICPRIRASASLVNLGQTAPAAMLGGQLRPSASTASVDVHDVDVDEEVSPCEYGMPIPAQQPRRPARLDNGPVDLARTRSQLLRAANRKPSTYVVRT